MKNSRHPGGGLLFCHHQAERFLGPIYPNSIDVAQYSGVCQAASIVHDEHIGIGKHYHRYRLPDSIERALFQCIQAHKVINDMSDFLKSHDTAVERLKELGEDTVKESDGPVTVGQYADNKLDALIQISRSHYISALEGDYKTFPYMNHIFLEKSNKLGAITSRTCFFIKTFEEWRNSIVLNQFNIDSFADLGMGVMDDAMVESAAYLFEKK